MRWLREGVSMVPGQMQFTLYVPLDVVEGHRLEQGQRSRISWRCSKRGSTTTRKSGSRRGVQDHAAALLLEERYDRVAEEIHALHVDRHRAVPLIFGDLVDLARGDDTGIVEENIDASELVFWADCTTRKTSLAAADIGRDRQ